MHVIPQVDIRSQSDSVGLSYTANEGACFGTTVSLPQW